ncbi:MAG TPA: MFS transporter [Mycobacteriales bacterium]|nr:MFS transporter [Mycobacteriales bacterium]
MPEFLALLTSSALSIVGDQVARIALALLVFDRTGSSFAAAATYACSYLTWLVTGLLLSTVADRLPRRRLMIVCDLLRAVAVGLLLVPEPPLVLIFAVLLAVGLLSPPFDAAKSAVLPEVLSGDAYVVGNGLQSSLFQAANAVGFLLGGALVAAMGVRTALSVDALSFLLSALVLSLFVRERAPAPHDGASLFADTRAGVSEVLGDPLLRRLLCFGLLGALVLITPEGLAVPVAAGTSPGAQDAAAGVLAAVAPAGFLLGSLVLLRLRPAVRLTLLPWLVVLSGVALLLSPLLDSTPALAALWLVAGGGSALLLVANSAYMQAVPGRMRGRAFGVANTALMVLQGLLLLGLGALAEVVDPRWVVSGAGAVALLVVLPLSAAPGSARLAARA